MVEGMHMQREYERNQHIQTLHVLRQTAMTLVNIGQSFSKNPKTVSERDIMPIPEIDEEIRKIEKKREAEFEQRAERVLEKYKRFTN